MDRSIDSIGSCSLDADSTDFSGNSLSETGKQMKEMGKAQWKRTGTLFIYNIHQQNSCMHDVVEEPSGAGHTLARIH